MKSDTAPFASAGATANVAEDRGNYRRTFTDYRALDRALESDDLPAAREAFARLQEDSSPLAEALSHHPFPGDNSHLRALKELGRTLGAGDLNGAKQAFRKFQ